MEQLSSIEPVFMEYEAKAAEFLSANTPDAEIYNVYHYDKMQKLQQGENVWIAGSPILPNKNKKYDLLDAHLHATVATIELQPTDNVQGEGQYHCIVYGDSERQAAFAEKMSQVRNWITTKGMSTRDTETVFLGMALSEIERIIADN
jgi:hypothetical protein